MPPGRRVCGTTVEGALNATVPVRLVVSEAAGEHVSAHR